MKKFSAFILVCALCFCALFTGCVDIWEGIEGDERVYEIHDDYGDFSVHGLKTWAVKLKKDNTAELYYDYYGWRPVSRSFGDEYADYNAQYKSSTVVYGTYKQIGNRLKITFAPYKEYSRIKELSGEDAEAFKTVFIENNPDRAEIFGKGIVSRDDIVGKELTLSVTGNECKPLSFVTKIVDGDEETWTYYSSGKIKSYKSGNRYSKKIYKYNTDGSYTETVYLNGVIYSYRKADSHGNFTVQRSYDSDGKLQHESTCGYEYDSNGNCTAQRSYDSDGKLKYEEQYEYDSSGKRTAYRKYNSEEKLLIEERYEYDSNGNCIAQREYDSEGKLINEKLSEYDSNGNRTAQREYDSNGNLISEEIWIWSYEYDSNGNITAAKMYDSNGELVYEKRYDY